MTLLATLTRDVDSDVATAALLTRVDNEGRPSVDLYRADAVAAGGDH